MAEDAAEWRDHNLGVARKEAIIEDANRHGLRIEELAVSTAGDGGGEWRSLTGDGISAGVPPAVLDGRWGVVDLKTEKPIAETGNLLQVEQLLLAERAEIVSGWTAMGELGFYCTIAREVAGIAYWQSNKRPMRHPDAPDDEAWEEGWVLLHVADPEEGFWPGQDPMLGVPERWDYNSATQAATWRVLWFHLHGANLQKKLRDARDSRGKA